MSGLRVTLKGFLLLCRQLAPSSADKCSGSIWLKSSWDDWHCGFREIWNVSVMLAPLAMVQPCTFLLVGIIVSVKHGSEALFLDAMNKEADARGQKHANRLSECLTSSLGNDLRNRLACVVQVGSRERLAFCHSSKHQRNQTGSCLRIGRKEAFGSHFVSSILWVRTCYIDLPRGRSCGRLRFLVLTWGTNQVRETLFEEKMPPRKHSMDLVVGVLRYVLRAQQKPDPTRHVWCDVNPRGLPDDPQSNPELLWPLISVLQTHQSLEGLGALDFRWWKGSKVALTYAKPEEPKDSSKKVSADYESMKDTVLPTGQKVFFWSFVATFGEANAQARRPFFCMAAGQKTACSVRLSVENATLSRSLSMDQTTIYPGRSNRHVGAQRWSVANSCT